jgi:1-phosphofructokinase
MIITITLNPSLDYTIFLKSELNPGSIHRTETYQLCAGGKGLNVSMILNQLQVPSVALTFLGGSVGKKIIEDVSQHSLIQCVPTWIKDESRINVKIRSSKETDINLKGPFITLNEQDQLLNKLNTITSDDWILVCGSLSRNLDFNFLNQIAQRVHHAKAKLVLDGIDLKLEDLVLLKPELIKPNLDELHALYPSEDITLDNYRSYASHLYKMTKTQVVVSLGSKGAYYCGQSGKYQVIQPEIQAINTVGAGDSMVAGMISVLSHNGSIEEALCLGAAAGAATAGSVGLSSLDQILSHQKLCSVIKLM